jgi:hypothetical protein
VPHASSPRSPSASASTPGVGAKIGRRDPCSMPRRSPRLRVGAMTQRLRRYGCQFAVRTSLHRVQPHPADRTPPGRGDPVDLDVTPVGRRDVGTQP